MVGNRSPFPQMSTYYSRLFISFIFFIYIVKGFIMTCHFYCNTWEFPFRIDHYI